MTARRRGVRRGRTPFELVVLLVSVSAVIAVAAGLVVARVSGVEGGADLRPSVDPAGVPRSGGLAFEVVIRNVGGETAENVVVEVTLGEETRELELLSISKGDQERATVVFSADAVGRPTVEVLSYHETTRG